MTKLVSGIIGSIRNYIKPAVFDEQYFRTQLEIIKSADWKRKDYLLGKLLSKYEQHDITAYLTKIVKESTNENYRIYALEILTKLNHHGNSERKEHLKGFINDESPKIRVRVLIALTSSDYLSKEEFDLLIKGVNDPDKSVKEVAIRILSDKASSVIDSSKDLSKALQALESNSQTYGVHEAIKKIDLIIAEITTIKLNDICKTYESSYGHSVHSQEKRNSLRQELVKEFSRDFGVERTQNILASIIGNCDNFKEGKKRVSTATKLEACYALRDLVGSSEGLNILIKNLEELRGNIYYSLTIPFKSQTSE